MRKYLKKYIKETESKLKDKTNKSDVEELIIKIKFFSHERLIHLIVTMFFALFTIIFFYISLTLQSFILMIVTITLLILLVFYIFHYFYLENGVQHLYKLYDEMNKK